jgi:hypothetical protein
VDEKSWISKICSLVNSAKDSIGAKKITQGFSPHSSKRKSSSSAQNSDFFFIHNFSQIFQMKYSAMNTKNSYKDIRKTRF